MRVPPALRRRDPPPLPWRAPRHELLLLVLVALATLTPVYSVDAQDTSRVCLARSLAHLEVTADTCLRSPLAIDKAVDHGQLYSDKAPGMSLLEVPSVAAARLGDPGTWHHESLRLWVPRFLSSGIAFLLGVFLVGRISEGIARGYGGVSMVVFGLGTLAAPFAVANFEHDCAGMLGLAAFALTWARRRFSAGLVAGAAILVAYEASLIVLVLAVYVALAGRAALARFLAGVAPGVALLAAYNWVAFGAPWRFSYDYIVGAFGADQASGFFGIHLPHLASVDKVFVGDGGLLVLSPVVVAGGYGLVLLGRRYRAEAVVCAAVVAAFVLLDCGYFDPYGGVSPGPRFLIPCLSFLALGLAPAFQRRFWITTLLAGASVIAMTAVTVTWVNLGPGRGTIWAQIGHATTESGRSPLVAHLTANVVMWLGASRGDGAILIACAAVAALLCALVWSRPRVGDRASGA